MSLFSFFATSARGLEAPLLAELTQLGLSQPESMVASSGGVAFSGTLVDGYEAIVRSRIASRILLQLAKFACPDREALYAGVRTIDWPAQLTSTTTFAVSVTRAPGASTNLHHTHYVALHTKDAIVDSFTEADLERPSIDTLRPGLRLVVHLEEQATLSVDLGGPLHQRGYRDPAAPAPLRETLAAGLLALAGYDGTQPLCDPFCGSGTIAVEAAMIAADVAPGVLRAPPTVGWRGHHAGQLADCLTRARQRHRPRPTESMIWASDLDPIAVNLCEASLHRAGLGGWVEIERADALTREPPTATAGLLVANLPYGERIGTADLDQLQEQLGNQLRRRFLGWRTFLLVGDERHGAALGLKAKRRHVLNNGPIECRLLEIPISDKPVTVAAPAWQARRNEEGEAFGNRLRKNYKHLGKWLRKDQVSCFRIYDADIPEFGLAVDVYEKAVQLQEYAYPSTINEMRAQERLRAAVSECAKLFELSTEQVFVKERRRHNRGEQYERQDRSGHELWVKEAGFEFSVNLVDYIDTGLYPDQRRLRALLESEAQGKRFLNLFAYTCTASAYAARGGARDTTSVDLSNTYLDWGRQNFARNRISGTHRFIKADVMQSLLDEGERYDLIFVAPPTFSNSKSMEGSFDVQRDHPGLLAAVHGRLAKGGVIYFTTHRSKFKMDEAALAGCGLIAVEITHQTMSPDYARRDAKFHRSYRITAS